MATSVLVAYATKHGATAGIAERIGEVLRQAGLACDVKLAATVDDLTPYQAVVLGSAVYMGAWRKEAAKFLKTQEAQLAQRPVWLFSSGPMGEGDVQELMKGWRFPPKLQPIADRIHPRDIVVFHGVVDPEEMNFFERWIIKNVKSPVGDFRDWNAIAAWASTIAGALQQEEAPIGATAPAP
ncbi:MAG: flavodoxin domain-containing protein [Caldilineaceae bacterium]